MYLTIKWPDPVLSWREENEKILNSMSLILQIPFFPTQTLFVFMSVSVHSFSFVTQYRPGILTSLITHEGFHWKRERESVRERERERKREREIDRWVMLKSVHVYKKALLLYQACCSTKTGPTSEITSSFWFRRLISHFWDQNSAF